MKKQPDFGRVSHKNAFESCYMRHQYLMRVRHNPTREEMSPYQKIVENFARNTFYTYKNLFLLVGLDHEDVLSNAQIQLVSFLGLYALERNQKRLADFKRSFRSHNSIICKKTDVLNKNRANFTCFLKQRMEDMVRVCRQKAKNIRGIPVEEYLVFVGKTQPPNDLEELLDNHYDYGYRPLGLSTFKTIKKRGFPNQDGPVYLHDEKWYVCVSVRKKQLFLSDFSCNNQNPYDNLHNMTPEDYCEKAESENSFERNYLKFKTSSDKEKARLIQLFMDEKSDDTNYEEEIEIAKKYLEKLDVGSNF